MPPALAKARRRLAERGYDEASRHIFLCHDTREKGCASAERMRRAWKHLKRRCEELDGRTVAITRTRCFGICAGGPIAVVYPDGVWYGLCEPDAIDRIVDEHVLRGRPVARHRIGGPEGDGA